VEHDGKYANLDSVDEVFTVGPNRAISLLAEKAASGGRTREAASSLKALGDHPTLGGPVTVRAGRFGPYVNHAKVNATLPRTVAPQDLTLEQAVKLLSEKAAKGGGRKAPGTPTTRKPAAKGRSKARAAAK
jgi:DNA topoisomerase-1